MNKRKDMRWTIRNLALQSLGLTTLGLIVLPGAARAGAGDPMAGATVFRKCASCHNVDPSGRNGVGPNLRGVVGRPAARVPGFNYSPAMTASKLVWTEPNLARFLTSPRQTIPGTRMTFAGLPNPQDRANVIAFLKQAGAKK
jgi:cytochrome c